MDFERLSKLAGVLEGIQADAEQFQHLTEMGEEDGSGVTDSQIRQLVNRYHRVRAYRDTGTMEPEEVKREQDDVFNTLSALVGGPHSAARYLMSSPLREASLTEEMITNTAPLPQRDNDMSLLNRILTLAGLEHPAPVVAPIVESEVVEVGTVVEEATTVAEDATQTTIVAEEAKEVKAEDTAPKLEEEKPAAKVKVPSDIKAAINQRIAELKASIAEYNEKGYNDGGVKVNAIEALEQILSDLGQTDGLLKANVFYGTLMSPIQHLLPPKVVKFIHSAPAK